MSQEVLRSTMSCELRFINWIMADFRPTLGQAVRVNGGGGGVGRVNRCGSSNDAWPRTNHGTGRGPYPFRVRRCGKALSCMSGFRWLGGSTGSDYLVL